MEDCIFCKIIKKEIPSKIVYEDEEIIAFRDIKPVTPVHVLVIPKKHIESLLDLKEEDEKLIGKIYTVINKIARQEGIAEKGFRVIVNCGEDGGQEVKHLHYHLLGGRKLGIKICG
ncbi:MAG: histidine triad nucleotide-binding protein [Clostridia bacterium]|nr:histidine triad nucleotide-binding protein [Clostridia bacterium]